LATAQQNYKITPISNLLGRDGTHHLILGLLIILPTGTLAIADLTGSISLNISNAQSIPESGVWFTPGMVVLVDGIYNEDAGNTADLSGAGGVGGAIGGTFAGISIGHPPSERRELTLGTSGKDDVIAGGGFGWVDFLGVGSERAVGSRMRNVQSIVLNSQLSDPLSDDNEIDSLDRNKLIILGDVALDQPATLPALRKILIAYSASTTIPAIFVVTGSFLSLPSFATNQEDGGSVEYKELFDSLASLLSEFPTLLARSKWIFVPGDNDGWESAFSAGGATILPRKPVPDIFTSRVKRAFATATAAEGGAFKKEEDKGEAVWTSNPARLSLFGPVGEVVIFRDDIGARLRRNAITLKKSPTPAPSTRIGATMNGNNDQVMSDDPSPSQEDSAVEPDEAQSESMDLDSQVRRAESAMPSSPPSSDVSETAAGAGQGSANQQSPLQPSPSVLTARKLTKTILDQAYLSPFPLSTRPVLWDYNSSLSLYPLPSLLVLSDTTTPAFCVNYCGTSVVNTGSLVGIGGGGDASGKGKRRVVRWVEVEVKGWKGAVKEMTFWNTRDYIGLVFPLAFLGRILYVHDWWLV
jgi:DNA polymerase epsilon subunit 2